MALSLYQLVKGTIVDRVSEWGSDGKERPLQEISRGIIVKVDGEPEQETVKTIWVCYGPNVKGQDESVTVNKVTVPCVRAKAAELIEVYAAESLHAKREWRRLFNIPTQVGVVFENRKARGGPRRKIKDELGLTARPEEGPVKEDLTPGGMKMKEEEDEA